MDWDLLFAAGLLVYVCGGAFNSTVVLDQCMKAETPALRIVGWLAAIVFEWSAMYVALHLVVYR